MADLRISELAALAGADLVESDLLAVADVSASETKKITVTDFTGKAVTLIADATIPGAKILFGSGQVPGSALVDGGVSTGKLADDAVTAAKLANESTVDLVTTLPATGAFTGQLALDTDDLKVYCWDGSAWRSIKAAGSINTVTGDSSGIVNISVTTSGDAVTISTSLDNTSAAGQFLAGPSGSAGAVSYRAIAGADLPTATTTAKGGVIVNGNGLTMSGNTIAVDNNVTANTSAHHLVQYTSKGLVTGGRAIQSGDLPRATSSTAGAAYPGTGLTVDVNGQINHTNSIVGGTFTKVTVDGQGHVSAGGTLVAADIPDIPATRLTSGTLSPDLLGTNSVTGAKLANYATVKFGGAGSTSGVVTFPAADFAGQQFFDATNGDLYLYDGNTWQPITVISGDLVYAGTYNAATNRVKSTTTQGSAAGFVAGSPLPAASSTNVRYYVVVADSGTGAAPAPAVALAPPDMLVSNGATYDLVDVSNAIAGQVASNISFTPYGNLAANNVQVALQELDDEKLTKAGDTVTGPLVIGPTGSLVFEGSSDDAFETTLAVVNPTADRTITLPDSTGTVITTGDTGSVTSTMIANGTIVDADISASAAIADTKLATISTSGKVANSATTAASANTASAIVARDASGNFAASTITAALSGNASTATALQTGRTIALTGDVTGISGAFNGSANLSFATTLANSGVVAGTYTKLTVDEKGRATSGANLAASDVPDLTLEKLPSAWVKNSVRVATTGNITLSGLQTIDGVSLVAGDRVLVKDQTTASQNGIYVASASAWSRAADADTIAELAGACVGVASGGVNGGFRFDTDLKSTDTLGTTAVTWYRVLDANDTASANTASKVVVRDASGNFSAGTITAALSGNATTATTLQTARTIQGVSFNGSANITVVTAGTGISVSGTAVSNTGVLSVNGNAGAITNVAVTNAAQAFTAAQRGTPVALTDGATITPDFAAGNNFSVTLGGNRTLAAPTNLVAGQSGTIVITQDATGSRTLAYASVWKFPGGAAPTLTTAANAVDVIAYYVESATRITARLISDVK